MTSAPEHQPEHQREDPPEPVIAEAAGGAGDVQPRVVSRRVALGRLAAGVAAYGVTSSLPSLGGAGRVSAMPAQPAESMRRGGAGAYWFRVGAFDAWALSDGALPLAVPPGSLFAATAPRGEADALLRRHFLPVDRVSLQCTYLLVRTGRDLVLVDTGSGDGFGPALGHLVPSLRLAGFGPGDVTAVVLTHGHSDHLWGVTDPAGRLAFPNARYYLPAVEWELWTAPGDPLARFAGAAEEKARQLAGARRRLPLLDGRVTLLAPGEREILPGLTALPVPGHTPGHMGVLIASGAEQLVYATDAAHHHALLLERPEWHAAFDFDPAAASRARRRFFDRVATERALVMGSHFPFPSLGHVRVRGTRAPSFEWVPAPWQWPERVG